MIGRAHEQQNYEWWEQQNYAYNYNQQLHGAAQPQYICGPDDKHDTCEENAELV